MEIPLHGTSGVTMSTTRWFGLNANLLLYIVSDYKNDISSSLLFVTCYIITYAPCQLYKYTNKSIV